jgi:nucleoside-diphosphate-sugar epimerase
MNVFLAGATGVLGRALVPRLLDAGHGVSTITRIEAKADALRAQGVVATVCDAFDADALREAVVASQPEVVVNQLTALPAKLPNPRKINRDLALTNRLRKEVTPVLVAAAAEAGARRVVSQSISFAYAPGPERNAEDAPLFTDAPKAFRPMIEGVVLRYGAFYGPGSYYAPDGDFTVQMRARKIPSVGAGTGETSFIHVDDAATATLAALDGPTGIYNVVDDEPSPASEWLPAFAEIVGAKPPRRVPAWAARLFAGPYVIYMMIDQRGALNAKAKAELGWTPRYASWREGFPATLGPI